MNKAQIGSLIRSTIITLAAPIAAKYGVEGALTEAVASGFVAAVMIAWGIWEKRDRR